MHWVPLYVVHALRRRDIVGQAANRWLVASHIEVLPLTQQPNYEVTSELALQDLGHEIDVLDEKHLQYNRDVSSVEQLDGVWHSVSSHLSAHQLQLDFQVLE